MVIVDTSVWSLALRRRRNQPNNDASIAELVRLIGEGEALMAGPIRQELLSGVASEEQFVPRWPPQIPPPVAGSNSPTPDGGTIEHFAGDGMMIFFNDPIVLPDAPASAVRMALALRESFAALHASWMKRGYDLHLGIGIAQGFATLGTIGFEGRRDYAAIGSVTNLSARLCSAAKGGQILTNQKTLGRVDEWVQSESVGALELKGFSQPVAAFNIVGLKP